MKSQSCVLGVETCGKYLHDKYASNQLVFSERSWLRTEQKANSEDKCNPATKEKNHSFVSTTFFLPSSSISLLLPPFSQSLSVPVSHFFPEGLSGCSVLWYFHVFTSFHLLYDKTIPASLFLSFASSLLPFFPFLLRIISPFFPGQI